VYEGASSLQKYAQNVHGMLCSKELSGDLDMARKNKRGMREIWLDIVDDSRVEIAYAKPSEDEEDAVAATAAADGKDAGAVTPGDAGAAGAGGVEGRGAPAPDPAELAAREAERVGEELGSYDFD
jgi:hypothetical protein